MKQNWNIDQVVTFRGRIYGFAELMVNTVWLWFNQALYVNSLIVSFLQSDIRELIGVDDVMEDAELKFGPNGGLVFCMEWVWNFWVTLTLWNLC